MLDEGASNVGKCPLQPANGVCQWRSAGAGGDFSVARVSCIDRIRAGVLGGSGLNLLPVFANAEVLGLLQA